MRASIPLLALALLIAGCGSANTSSAGNTGGSNPSNPFAFGGENHVHSIVVPPQRPDVVYLGSHYQLYRSNDGGFHWHGLLSQMMVSMTLDPSHPSRMYGITLQSGLLRSTDAGVHWQKASAGVAKGKVTGIVFEPYTGAVLSYGAGIYRSTDGALHWKNVLPGVHILNMSVGGNGTVYATTLGGLELSRDGGIHWTRPPVFGSQPVLEVGSAGTTAYLATPIGLYRTADGGRSWHILKSAPQGIEYLSVAEANPNEVIAETLNNGFIATENGGKSWHPANTGIHDTNFSASTIRIAPSSPGVAYTGSWGVHFYASHNGGRSWVRTAVLTH